MHFWRHSACSWLVLTMYSLARHVVRAGSRSPNYLRHWRYYYDPPEFLTVIRGNDKKQFHIGYYRYMVMEMLTISCMFVLCY